MINKEHLWFLTLFSLILVLSVYYITMPNDLLLSRETFENSDEKESVEIVNVNSLEDDLLMSLRLDLDENRQSELKDLQAILTNSETTIDEKNDAYEKIHYLNSVYGDEEKLEKKVKECCNIDSFIEINNNEISVVGVNSNHSVGVANKIMRAIQEEYNDKVSVTVSFK